MQNNAENLIESGQLNGMLEDGLIHAVFNTVDAFIIVADKNGGIIFLNNKCAGIFQYSLSNVKGKLFWEVFPVSGEKDDVETVFKDIKNKVSDKHKNKWISKTGEKFVISWSREFFSGDGGEMEYAIITGNDITKLDELQTGYNDLIENTPLCIKVFDEKGKLIFLNKGGREEHFIKDDQDISKWDWLATVKKEYQTEAKEKFERAFSKGESSRIEFEHVPEGSSHEWCSSLISPIKDEKGNVKSVLFLSDDVTALKRAELEAKKNEQMFRTLIDKTPLCIKWFDNKGKLISINQGGREEHFLTDKTEEEIKKWDYMGCIDEAYRPLVKDKILLALKGETSNFEIKHFPGTAKGMWCFSTLTPVTDSTGKVIYVLFLSRDITEEKTIDSERKRNLEKAEETKSALFNILEDVKDSEKSLKEERDRSKAIISSMGESLLVVDKNYEVVLMNSAAEKNLRMKSEAVIGHDIRKVITAFRGGDIAQGDDDPLGSVFSGKGVFSAKLEDNYYYQISSTGKKFPVMFISTPLISEEGIMGAILVFRDITDEKALDESKSGFISIASHQLRTPLTSLRWFSEMLLGGDAGPLSQNQKNFVEKIHQSTERMVDLVNLLLQIARVEAGRLKVDPLPLNLKDLTNFVIASLKTDLDKKSQIVEIKTEPDPFPEVALDQSIIWQVLQNLISNAIRYSPIKQTISISIIKKDGVIEYSVKDRGIGIPKDQENRIFEKFFRAENALKAVPGGSGLGLSLAKSLVEGWGGKIWFESDKGEGTAFIFTIPSGGMEKKEGEVKLDV